jgi:hypothetical protein
VVVLFSYLKFHSFLFWGLSFNRHLCTIGIQTVDKQNYYKFTVFYVGGLSCNWSSCVITHTGKLPLLVLALPLPVQGFSSGITKSLFRYWLVALLFSGLGSCQSHMALILEGRYCFAFWYGDPTNDRAGTCRDNTGNVTLFSACSSIMGTQWRTIPELAETMPEMSPCSQHAILVWGPYEWPYRTWQRQYQNRQCQFRNSS